MIQMSSTVPLDLCVEKYTILSIVPLDQIRLVVTCIKALLKEEDGEEPESQSAIYMGEWSGQGRFMACPRGTYMLFAAMEEDIWDHF